MLVTIIMLITIAFLPRLLLLAVDKFSVLGTLGPVFLCYLTGLLLSAPLRGAGADLSLASDLSSILVCIGMPLILFSADLPALKKLAKPMTVSFLMNIFAVVLVAVASFFLFRNIVPEVQNISGMLIGTYTGGTPNMFAIGNGLGADSGQIILLQTSDMIGGGLYFLLLISVMPRLLRKFLPEYIFEQAKTNSAEDQAEENRYVEELSGKKQSVKPLRAFLSRLALVALAVGCVGVALGITLLLPSRFGNTGLAKAGEYTAVIMLVVTTLGIALSFVKKVRNAHGSYGSGQYFILMFSVAMGLCFDYSAIGGALIMLGMLFLVQFGTVIVHLIMAKIGKIDYHTMMITSTAGVFGPAFIIPVAKALHNDEIILPGILCGILGYAIGNYLGIGVGELLKMLM